VLRKQRAASGSGERRAEGKRGGRPPVYDAAFVWVLIAIWQDHGQMCGKLLAPMIRSMVDFLAASTKPGYGITAGIRELLLRVSPAEADILLKPARKAQKNMETSFPRYQHDPVEAYETKFREPHSLHSQVKLFYFGLDF
jgi:hypothetical protein